MKTKLNKRVKAVIAIYAVVALAYIVAFFLIPFRKITASWISFAFTHFALIVSLLTCGRAFRAKNPIVSRIYGYPIFRVGFVYAFVQFVAGIAVCAVGAFVAVPYWAALSAYIILFGAALVGIIATDTTRDLIEEIDKKIKADTKNVVLFQIDIKGIVSSCGNEEVKAELESLSELFEYSDPVSNDYTKELEESIKTMLTELKALATDGSTEDIRTMVNKIANTLKERNRLCKATKGI